MRPAGGYRCGYPPSTPYPSPRGASHLRASHRANDLVLQKREDSIYIVRPIQQRLAHDPQLLLRDAHVEKVLAHVALLDPILVELAPPPALRWRRVGRRARALDHARRVEARFAVPRVQRHAGVQAASHGLNGLERGFAPEGQHPGRVRVPGEGGAVAFAGREEAAGPADAAHFADDGDLVGEVDEDLVREDDVEGGVREGEAGEDVAGLEGEVAGWVGGAGGEGPGLVEDGVGGVDARHGAVGDVGAEAGGDGAGAAAEVEDPVVWFDVGKEECGVFGCGAGCVAPRDGLVVALRVAAGLAVHVCH